MILDDVVRVGKRGEILPKKKLRALAGISPGDRVLVEAHSGNLIIRKILSVKEALDLPVIASGTPEEIEKDLEEEGHMLEDLV